MSDRNIGAVAAKRSYPRLTKWAAIFTTACVVIITVVQLYQRFGPVSLPDCDDSMVQTSIRNIFRDQAKIEISVMGAFTPLSKAAGNLACTADLTFSDKSRARLGYRVYLEDNHVMVATGDIAAL